MQRLPSHRKEVLLVRADKGKFVLKVCGISAGKWLFNESRTLHELALNGIGIAPRCLLGATIFGDKCYQLTEFIPGEPVSGQLGAHRRCVEPGIIRQAASLLRMIHDLPIEPPEGSVTLDGLLEIAEDNLKCNLLDPEEFVGDDPRQMLSWLKAARPQPSRMVFTHGDYRPKNLLIGSQRSMSVIDWEHAIWCSPYYDLAVFSYYLKPEEQDLFLDAYGLDTVAEDLFLYYDQLSKFLNI